MADASPEAEDEPKKPSKMPLIIGLVLALVGGGGGFFATWSGMILAPNAEVAKEKDVSEENEGPSVAYVAIDPLVISLPESAKSRHLRFRAQLEVPPGAQEKVDVLLPRVVDVLNSYLRALETSDLEDPSALARLRSQMLRRVQVVTGPGNVNDLLIMEFVLT
ncbi:MAG: flagellar basal body-associated FliL family protein [Pseudomonadota bacterium]